MNKPCVYSSTMRLSTFCGLHRDTEHLLYPKYRNTFVTYNCNGSERSLYFIRLIGSVTITCIFSSFSVTYSGPIEKNCGASMKLKEKVLYLPRHAGQCLLSGYPCFSLAVFSQVFHHHAAKENNWRL
jgi:hypothetical protein